MADEDEDFEAEIRRQWTNEGFWQEYRRSTKIWTRICEKCTENICSPSVSCCAVHQKKKKKPIKRLKNKTKDLDIPDQVQTV